MADIRLLDEILEDTVELDKTDRKILYQLMIDGRQPLSDIGRKAHVSEQVVSYRINKMQERGVISDFLTILEISKLGFGAYRAFFRLANVTPEKEREIIKHFGEHPNVFWLVRTGGRWDLLVDFMTENIARFDEELQHSMNTFQGHLQNKEVMTFLDSHHFRRDYLHPETGTSEERVYFGGVPQEENLDRTDLEILKSIATDARKPYRHVADEIEVSPNTVKHRIGAMEDAGVIQGYSPRIHPTVFDCPCYKILLTVHNLDEQKEQRLIRFAKEHENVIFIEKIVGSWNFEFDIECNDDKEFRTLMRQMKDELSDIVVDYETITFYYDYKVNYFPVDIESVIG